MVCVNYAAIPISIGNPQLAWETKMRLYHHGQYRALFEALEERVLFDGVPDATFVLPNTDGAGLDAAQFQDLSLIHI